MAEEGPLFDCLWSRLIDLSFVYRYGPDAISVVATLSATCSLLRRELIRLWLDIRRPYLAQLCLEHSFRAVLCEMEQRRLIERTTECLGLVGTEHVCVAGGYAAWQLERHVDSAVGRDAFPRTVRGIELCNTRHVMNDIWTPGDVDLFVHSDDVELTMDVVSACYREYTDVLFGSKCKVYTSCHLGYGDETPDEDPYLPTSHRVEQLARRTDLPEYIVDRCVHHHHAHTPGARANIVVTAWNLMAHARDPMLPSRLNVIFTKKPPCEEDYAAWITSSFDLRHCCVIVDVARDGTLHYRVHPHTVRVLSARRLEFTPGTFANETTCANTMRRIQKYMSNGFSIFGDDKIDADMLDRIVARDAHIHQISFHG